MFIFPALGPAACAVPEQAIQRCHFHSVMAKLPEHRGTMSEKPSAFFRKTSGVGMKPPDWPASGGRDSTAGSGGVGLISTLVWEERLWSRPFISATCWRMVSWWSHRWRRALSYSPRSAPWLEKAFLMGSSAGQIVLLSSVKPGHGCRATSLYQTTVSVAVFARDSPPHVFLLPRSSMSEHPASHLRWHLGKIFSLL